VIEPILENFRQIRPNVDSSAMNEQLDRLEKWSQSTFETLSSQISQRKADGFVRACHGDVHLANMAWLDDGPVLFDCIEFNSNLRWIDVINDVAFLVMDLDDRIQTKLGWIFLNCYLQETGDYAGIALLNLYKCYRAMVRAKVTCLRLAQGHLDDEERIRVEKLFRGYLDLAERYTRTDSPMLIITHGLSGAGKSTFSEQLANVFGAIHIRSDIERKRLYGLTATDWSCSPIDGGIYSAEAFAKTYLELSELAGQVLSAGIPVIVDGTFIKQHQRELFRKLANNLQIPFIILDFPVPEEELRRRIAHRTDTDASEATLEVLAYQLAHEETLTSIEMQQTLIVRPDASVGDVIAKL